MTPASGDERAASRLADLLCKRGDLDQLRARADAGDSDVGQLAVVTEWPVSPYSPQRGFAADDLMGLDAHLIAAFIPSDAIGRDGRKYPVPLES
jgi:hypothetical protein